MYIQLSVIDYLFYHNPIFIPFYKTWNMLQLSMHTKCKNDVTSIGCRQSLASLK